VGVRGQSVARRGQTSRNRKGAAGLTSGDMVLGSILYFGGRPAERPVPFPR
jgi:hypothetical protein